MDADGRLHPNEDNGHYRERVRLTLNKMELDNPSLRGL